MKFSDAVVLGMTICPRMDGEEWQTCLIGVAWQAEKGVGASVNSLFEFNAERATRHWPWLLQKFANPFPLERICSQCSHEHTTARHIISHVACAVANGLVSLEAVVQWIRSVEPEESPELDKQETALETCFS